MAAIEAGTLSAFAHPHVAPRAFASGLALAVGKRATTRRRLLRDPKGDQTHPLARRSRGPHPHPSIDYRLRGMDLEVLRQRIPHASLIAEREIGSGMGEPPHPLLAQLAHRLQRQKGTIRHVERVFWQRVLLNIARSAALGGSRFLHPGSSELSRPEIQAHLQT